jgi:predicted RNA-binding protein with RPS1 domain
MTDSHTRPLFFLIAFTTSRNAFVSTRVVSNGVVSVTGQHGASCSCSSCTHPAACVCSACVRSHSPGCACIACGSKTSLRMSDSDEEVPSEVASLDGIASEDEAHNTERPARDSGLKKKKKEANKGTPLSDLQIGSYVDGTVKTITAYGAFVDIGAASDALLHVSRLSNSFVSNVEDVVKQGDKVNVRIVSVDTDKNQIAISMVSEEDEKAATERSAGGRRKERPQRSQGDRGAQIATLNDLNAVGFDDSKMIEGEVVSTLDFGAFVRFDASQLADVTGELDGLVHISALTAGRADSVKSVVSVGDKVQVRVRELDIKGKKVSLSMISKEEEEANRPAPREKKQGGRGKQMFTADQMGPADWKEQLEGFQKDNDTTFVNMPIIVNKKKVAA